MVLIDTAINTVYFTAAPLDPTQCFLYRASLSASSEGAVERLTPGQAGQHSYSIAPGGSWAVHTHSSFGSPPTVSVIELPTHRTARVLQPNTELRQRIGRLASGGAEFFEVEVGAPGWLYDQAAAADWQAEVEAATGGSEQDGRLDGKLQGWVIYPPGFDKTQKQRKKYPLLLYVYGGPGSCTVADKWDSKHLWHLLMTQRGFVVASVDGKTIVMGRCCQFLSQWCAPPLNPIEPQLY